MWFIRSSRTSRQTWVDRSLCVYLVLVVGANFLNLYQIYDIASWEELRILISMSILAGVLIPLLWVGANAGLEVTKIFYTLQIPSTLALGTFFYDFDGGLKIAVGYLNSAFRFNYIFFHTNFSIGLLNRETDGTSYGVLINLCALGISVYYFLRTAEKKNPDQSGAQPAP